MHKKRFCPSCGKIISDGTFCAACSPHTTISYKNSSIKLCPTTKRFLWKNKWKPYRSLDDVLSFVALSSVKRGVIVQNIQYPKEFEARVGRTYSVLIVLRRDAVFVDVPIVVEFVPDPRQKHGQYFEGVLQLRHASPDILDTVRKAFSKKKVMVAKEVQQKDGSDLYVSSNKLMQIVATQLQKQFGGTISKHAQLFSRNRQTSKEVYRVNLLLTFPVLQQGNVFLYRNTPVVVVSQGKDVKIRSLRDNHVRRVPYPKDPVILPVSKTQVIQTKPYVCVLHPTTFQNEPVRNFSNVRVNQKVYVVEHNGLWLV